METSNHVNEITVVDGDDWIGIYINGTLRCEGHGGRQHGNLLQLGSEHQPFRVRSVFCDVSWLHDSGSLPESLSDVVIVEEATLNADLAAQ